MLKVLLRFRLQYDIIISLSAICRLFAREDGQKVVHISGLRNVRVDSVNLLLEV